MIRHRIRLACTLLALASLAAPPALAANKDMIQLQTEVQTLQTAVARLQQSNDESMGVLKDLVQQSTDSVNKMSLALATMQQRMTAQQNAAGTRLDQFSNQIQTLNDSLDEIKIRLDTLGKGLKSVQDQQRSINATLQNIAPPTTAAPGTAGMATQPTDNSAMPAQAVAPTSSGGQPDAANDNGNNPPADNTPFPATQGPYANSAPTSTAYAPPSTSAAAATPATPAAFALYNAALKDYVAARYKLASSGFVGVIRAYPTAPYAGSSYYYLGEIDYRTGRYANAIKDYDHVLDDFPGSSKAPVAYLHKALALFQIHKREAGIIELRALIVRFPDRPEASQARSKLNGMGVPIIPRRTR